MNKNMKINNFKIKIKSIYIFILLLILNIEFSFAQDNGYAASQSFKETANNITNNVLTSASTLLMTGAFVVFFYGLARFIYDRAQGKDGNELKKGKEFMMWGLIALFVMVSVWGIIKLAQGLLDVESNEIKIQPVKFAQLDTGGGSGGGGGGGGTNTDPLKKGKNTEDGDFIGTKKLGDVCKVLVGSVSECAEGMQCLGENRTSLGAGKSGTCQYIIPRGGGMIGTPDLVKPGDSLSGEIIDLINKNLIKYKCFPDGIKRIGSTYDDVDAKFVENFQKANNILVDGKIGDQVWKIWRDGNGKNCSQLSITALPNSPFRNTKIHPVIKLGMPADEYPSEWTPIGDAYYALYLAGCSPGVEKYNSGRSVTLEMVEAIKRIQKVNNLEVDGIAGASTLEVLDLFYIHQGGTTKYLSPNITVKACQ